MTAPAGGEAAEGGPTLPAGTRPAPDELRAVARVVLEAHWRGSYTVPNGAVYPFQWLWDSCFHALVWNELGEPARAVAELGHLFRTQTSLGFVPHVDYEWDPDHHAAFWGCEGRSALTQPPMFGHALAELWRSGVDVEPLIGPAERGLGFLLDHRARIDGLVAMCHPWESGGDDSPRWDHWCPPRWTKARWFDVKGELVAALELAPDGSPVGNDAFRCAPAGFSALVAFNAFELAEVTGSAELTQRARELAGDLDQRWDTDLVTWVDAGEAEASSGRLRTLEGLLPVLVSQRAAAVDAAFAQMLDPSAHGGTCGPTQVHRTEPAFEHHTYWRGPAWPQLTYLCWLAAHRRGRRSDAERLASMLVGGASRSGWAEYWDADDGTGLGAVPQSWATLAVLVDARR